MYEIERDVPIPKGRRPGPPKIYPIQEMEIGDSFLIPNEDVRGRKSVTQFVVPQAKRYGYRLTTRKLSDGGFRVWRVE